MLTKKSLLNKIDELYVNYSHITNFDELYKKIMESYQTSKTLINEQILQYDKKIIQNNAIVDTRLDEFRSKIDLAIDESYASNKKWLDDQKDNFFEASQEYKSKLMELSSEINDSIDQKLTNKELEITSNLNSAIEKQSGIWSDRMTEITNEVNVVLDKYELDVNEMLTILVTKKINETLIEDISQKASEHILHAFNKTLVELKQPEANSIIEAIKGLLNKQLGVILKEEETRKPIKPIGKNELFHKNHDKLKLCIDANTKKVPIIPMLVGPSGTGKSTAVEQIAREFGLHFYMANRIQNTFELVGFVDASGNYVTTQFYEAFTKGGLFLFDEVDASSPEALVTINAALAQGYMAFPGHPRALNVHPDFKVVCAGNTFGSGATLAHNGRNKLDDATLDRFMIIEWGYDEELEKNLVKDKALLEFCWELRDVSSKIDESVIISTRGMLTLDKVYKQNVKTKAFENEEILKQKFFETTKKEYLHHIIQAMGKTMHKNKYYQYLELLDN